MLACFELMTMNSSMADIAAAIDAIGICSAGFSWIPVPDQRAPGGQCCQVQGCVAGGQVVDEGFQGRPVLQMRMTLPSEGMARMIASHLDALPIDLDFIGPDGKLAPLAN